MPIPHGPEEALVEEYKQTLRPECRGCLIADFIIRGNLGIEKTSSKRIHRTQPEMEKLIEEQLGACVVGLTIDVDGEPKCNHPLYTSWPIRGQLKKLHSDE